MMLPIEVQAKIRARVAKDACPVATQDIVVNLQNRQTCIEKANYGPLNPEEPNDAYWERKASQFKTSVEDARSAVCGNCSAFVQTKDMMDCIVRGIDPEQDEESYAQEVAASAGLGYCELFDFKCAASRTCDAWLVGGPIVEDVAKENPTSSDVHVPTIMGGGSNRKRKKPKGKNIYSEAESVK